MKSVTLRPFVQSAQALLIVLVIAWVLNVPARLGFGLYTEQFLAAILGLVLMLVFLTVPAVDRPGRQQRVPLYDILAALVGLAACWYVSVRYPQLVNEIVYRPLDGIIVAGALVLLVLEATRRTTGLTLVLVILALVTYAMLGHLLPAEYQTRQVDLTRLLVYLGIDTNAILGLPLNIAIIVIVPFVLMGQILMGCGGGDFFTDLARSLMGRRRGGSAKISVLGSGLFGMISGSAVANVAAVGSVTIPLMKRAGFPGRVAGAVEAVGSTGGQLMPPVMGAAAFLIAEFIGVPYGEVVIAAFVPALLYYTALFMQVDLEAAKRAIAGEPREALPRLGSVLREGWHFPLPFVVLVTGLIAWNWRAEYAALLAAGVLLLFAVTFGYRGRRIGLRDLLRTLAAAGGAALEIIVITAAAGIVIGALNITGLAFSLTMQLLAVSGESAVALLLMTAAVSIVLGMGMPTVGVYVIMATLAAPALIRFGLSPMQAHLFVLYFGMMSMVTPPVALAAFAAANIARAGVWETAWTTVRIGWSAYLIPFLFVMSPTLLLAGEPAHIAGSVATAMLGVYMGSIAVVGFMMVPIGVAARCFYGLLGVLLLVPSNAFAGAAVMNGAAFLLSILMLAREVRRGGNMRERPA